MSMIQTIINTFKRCHNDVTDKGITKQMMVRELLMLLQRKSQSSHFHEATVTSRKNGYDITIAFFSNGHAVEIDIDPMTLFLTLDDFSEMYISPAAEELIWKAIGRAPQISIHDVKGEKSTVSWRYAA
jgi:hypothetical protein